MSIHRTRPNRRSLTVAALLAVALPSAAHADTLYGIDSNSGMLVTIDSGPAAITEVGLVGKDLAINDLAFLGTRLFGIDTQYPDGANLVEIDPITGTLLSSVLVTLDGEPAVNGIESLAADDRGLVIGMWNGAGDPAYSTALGRIDLDGAVTALTNFGTDFDGLCARGDGPFIGVDRDPPSSRVYLVTAEFGEPASLTSLTDFGIDDVFNGVDDPIVSNGVLYTCDAINHFLHRHDVTTGELLMSTPYDPRYRINVLATMTAPCLGDVDQSGAVDIGDLLILLATWGPCTGDCPADVNRSGAVDVGDLLVVLGAWGPCT